MIVFVQISFHIWIQPYRFSIKFSICINSGGGSIELPGEKSYISTPPLSVILSQQLVEHIEDDSTTMRLERDLFGMTASITKEAVTLCAFYMVTQIDSVTTCKNVTA